MTYVNVYWLGVEFDQLFASLKSRSQVKPLVVCRIPLRVWVVSWLREKDLGWGHFFGDLIEAMSLWLMG